MGIRVKVSISGQDQSVTITIDDNGPGISKNDRAEAVKPFNRIDTARNQNRKGVGLGLSIASDVVQAHGGILQLLRQPSWRIALSNHPTKVINSVCDRQAPVTVYRRPERPFLRLSLTRPLPSTLREQPELCRLWM